jgi:hypothetical protein
MIRWVDVQGNPVPWRLAKVIGPALKESGATLLSGYRGPDRAARKILRKHGKHTQGELYIGWLKRLPGFNPANPPGLSTHELRSDGRAYPYRHPGAPLAWWQLGMDVDDAHVDRFLKALRRRGVQAWRPYPGSREYHHVNIRAEPPRRLWLRP